ncbi:MULTISPECIES: ABC transporter ATP-binding protein [unclassified Halomonas]|uniref:ABC transporter ATP-binding protein n=1 Tax=unclassified Halomonas TaxID=2609666 RepID=UPI000F5E4F95|nr:MULTISPECIES: ABC transporter ATP-binding protein [unclassified Halomonas]MCJ8285430.1 ABC transporter ATP-binding protein [Halomonas sp.]NQY70823.1 ABC transporter ATP-binding protein [Halomonas sp.]RQW72135.1 ABC transporter ATP-binding protein [Halomonas sp. YLB-10]
MSELPELSGRGRGRHIALVVGLGIIQAGLMMATAFATRDVFVALRSTPGSASTQLPLTSLLILAAAALVIAACQALARVRGEAIGQSYAVDLRSVVFHAIAALGAERAGRRLGGLSLRFVGDLTAARGWVGMGITRLVSAAVVFPMAALCLWLIDPVLALAGMLPIFVAVALAAGLGLALGRLHRDLRRRRAGVAIAAMERIPIARELALMNRLPREIASLERKGRRSAEDAVRRVRRVSLLRALPNASLGLGGAAVLWATARFGLAAADAAAALSVLAILVVPVRECIGVWDRYSAWCVARDKCRALLARTEALPRVRRRGRPVPLDLEHLRVGGCTLHLRIRAGQRVCLATDDPDLASRVLAVLARRRAPEAGRLRFDGLPTEPAIACIGDRPALLRGSLRRALTMGAAARPDDDDIGRVARECGLGPAIARLGGLDGRIEEAGHNLTPGESLRVALVQALLSRPDLVVVDSYLWPLLKDAVELFTLLDARCPATLVHNLPDSVTGGAGMLLRLSENMDHPKTPSVCGNSKLGS